MADITLSVNPEKVTLGASSNDQTINIDAAFTGTDDTEGTAFIDNLSGTLRFNTLGAADGTKSAPYTTTDKIVLDVKKGQLLHVKGSGSETFNINISKSN